jgi:uncharacterized repeat protein (TIGR01451 family)
LPPQAAVVSSTGGGEADQDGTVVNWLLPSLGAGQQQELLLKCQLGAAGLNRLQASCTAGELKDDAAVARAFPLSEEVTYEVHVKNRGTKAAEGVEVTMYFAEGLDPIGADGTRHELSDGKVQFQTISSIAPDKETVLRVRARATETGNHIYRVEVQCNAADIKLGKEGATRFFGDGGARR